MVAAGAAALSPDAVLVAAALSPSAAAALAWRIAHTCDQNGSMLTVSAASG